MAATEEQKAILSVLRVLRNEGETWSRHRRPLAATAVATVAERQFTALKENELVDYLLYRGKVGQFDDGRAIYIEPPPKEQSSVAAIWCRWNFDLELPSCGFYFGVWSAREAFSAADRSDSKTDTCFIGYRYETPEQGDNHN